MDNEEKRNLIELYEKRIEKFGVNIRTVGWSSVIQQIARFEALIKISDLNDKVILDVGCGFGELFDYLKYKNIKIKKYYGIDLSDNMIKIARDFHKERNNAEFKILDILINEEIGEYKDEIDYIFASGIFSYPIKDNWKYLKQMLIKMFEICKLGVAVNMPTTYVDYKDNALFYYEPEKVFSFCKGLSRRVSLIHDYMPFEFTIYLFKLNTFDKNNVFSEFRNENKLDNYDIFKLKVKNLFEIGELWK